MFALLEMGDFDAGELGPAKRAGETQQQQRPVAPPRQVVADRRDDLAQNRDLGSELRLRALARLLGELVQAREGLGDPRGRRRGGASGKVMQVADGGEPQLERIGRERLSWRRGIAVGGKEGGNVGGPGGEGGEAVLTAPGTPGAHTGAVGASRIVRLGAASEDVGNLLRCRQRAVRLRDLSGDRGVEPRLHRGRRRLDRCRIGRRREGGRNQARRDVRVYEPHGGAASTEERMENFIKQAGHRMRILITGNLGYVGSTLVQHLRSVAPRAEIIGYDAGFFAHCLTGAETLPETQLTRQHFGDVRELPPELLEGVDAIVHLAAISEERPDGQSLRAGYRRD